MGKAPGTLGRYQVLKHLASGGMARVLLARSQGIEGFERHVVIKQIHPERAQDEHVVKMFLDEARLAASLHHTNIVQVHDIGQEKGEYFFAMEYVHGEDLRKLLNHVANKEPKQTIPFEHVVTIVTSAAAALHYAHQHRGLNIVHRDVSPANILVGFDGNVKVVDFGIAKATLRSSETQSGTLKGKISYMAPEQCMGQEVDRRSDVFALGIVLYELSTVRRLFKGSSDFLTMTAIVQGTIPRPSTHRSDIPRELEDIIMKALAKDAGDRYQTAEELRLALEQFAARNGIRGSATTLADYMTQQFGNPVEPWLVEDDEPEIELSVDFDGSDSGIVPIPTDGRRLPMGMPTPPPGSLIARARRKQAPASGIDITPMPPAPTPTTGTGWGANDKAPTTASGTPMAWEPSRPAAPVRAGRRRWGLAIGFAVPLLAVVVVFAVTRSSGTGSQPPQNATTPQPAAPMPPLSPPPSTTVPTEQPASISPAPTEVGSTGSGSAIASTEREGSGSAIAAKVPAEKKPKRPIKPKKKPNLDPRTHLFPK